MYVADERLPALAQSVYASLGVVAEKLSHQRFVRHAVHANVYDGRAGLHVLAAYEARAPDGRDEDVRLARDSREVARARVADGDGRVALQEEFRDGASDDVAPSDDDGARAAHLHALALQ